MASVYKVMLIVLNDARKHSMAQTGLKSNRGLTQVKHAFFVVVCKAQHINYKLIGKSSNIVVLRKFPSSNELYEKKQEIHNL